MLNILTIDVEDFYQVSAFDSFIKRENWGEFESRLERNTYHLLEILEESGKEHPSLSPNSERPTLNSLSSPSTSRPTPSEHNAMDSVAEHSILDTQDPVPSNLSPEDLDSSPNAERRTPNSLSSPCTLRLEPCSSDVLPPAPDTLPPASGVKATFFCLGWNAERYPNLVREIRARGHEIACHGYDHRLVYTMAPKNFREDVRKSKKILEDLVGEKVAGYRAPSYSITRKSLWAFEILAEEGFRYDSSIFPIHHDRYGIADAPRFPFWVDLNGGNDPKFIPAPSHLGPDTFHPTPKASRLTPHASQRLIEIPVSTVRLFGQNMPISGGGYFRLLPYFIIRRGLRKINEDERKSFTIYIHPWEFDKDQPRMKGADTLSRFRHYVNLHRTESKFIQLMTDFRFSTIRDVVKLNQSATVGTNESKQVSWKGDRE